jgi:hypothetical protein
LRRHRPCTSARRTTCRCKPRRFRSAASPSLHRGSPSSKRAGSNNSHRSPTPRRTLNRCRLRLPPRRQVTAPTVHKSARQRLSPRLFSASRHHSMWLSVHRLGSPTRPARRRRVSHLGLQHTSKSLPVSRLFLLLSSTLLTVHTFLASLPRERERHIHRDTRPLWLHIPFSCSHSTQLAYKFPFQPPSPLVLTTSSLQLCKPCLSRLNPATLVARGSLAYPMTLT